jgi:hypothetical protein
MGLTIHVVAILKNFIHSIPHRLLMYKKILNNLNKLYEEGKVKSVVTEVVDFKDIKDACLKVVKKHNRGKVAAVINKAT